MLKEAIQQVHELAVKATGHEQEFKKIRRVDVPTDGRKVWYQKGDEVSPVDVPPPLRNHHVDSVDDLIAAAKKWKGDAGNVIWISNDKLVLVIDDNDRRELVTLPLVESFVFERIGELADHPTVSQLELVRLLRVDLRGVVNAAVILSAVRKLKFRQAESGHADIQHGNESMGRSIEAEVTGADAIPESLIVETNLFCNPGLDEARFPIGLDLEIDVKNQRFLLRPIPDEIEKVTAAQLGMIRDQIEEALGEDMPVFFGRP